jgi:hypothetical protein
MNFLDEQERNRDGQRSEDRKTGASIDPQR